MEILWNNVKVYFDQFNAYLLNKSNCFKKKKFFDPKQILSKASWMDVLCMFRFPYILQLTWNQNFEFNAHFCTIYQCPLLKKKSWYL